MHPTPVIKIFRDETHSPNVFVVDWMLHDKCTYDCSYCPPSNKKGVDDWLDLDKLDQFCDHLETHVSNVFPGAKIKALFTGGEPTVWSGFSELVKRLSERNWDLFVNSNGSRSLRWWQEHAPLFKNITLSYHTEHVNDDDFLVKALMCASLSDLGINVMMNPNPTFFNKALNFSKRIIDIDGNFAVYHHRIQYNFGLTTINVVPYTDDQITILNKLKDRWSVPTRSQLDNYFVQYADGVKKLNGINLINNNQANFQNFSCHAGIESIFIDAKGDVIRGTCRVGGKLGNINSPETIKWPTGPITCPISWCGCITDIMNSKENPRLTTS